MLIVKGGERLPTPDVIPTPSLGLNYTLGGGLWSGRVHVFWGNTQAGKSTLSLHIAAEAQQMGYHVIVIDAEGTTTDEWAEQCGVDLENRTVIRSTRMQDILNWLMPKMREKDSKYFVIVDSINSLVADQFHEKDGAMGKMAYVAGPQTVFMQKLSDVMIGNTNHCMVLIAQLTAIIGDGKGPVVKGKYGNAVEHWASNIVHLFASTAASNVEKDEDQRILGRDVKWKIDKSKQAPVQGTVGHYWFSPESAEIDKVKEAIHLAGRHGIIRQAGAWYYYGDEKYHGEDKLKAGLTPEDIDDIFEQLRNTELELDVEEVRL